MEKVLSFRVIQHLSHPTASAAHFSTEKAEGKYEETVEEQQEKPQVVAANRCQALWMLYFPGKMVIPDE